MLFAASRTQLTQPGDHSVWEGVWVENSEKLRHFLWYRNSYAVREGIRALRLRETAFLFHFSEEKKLSQRWQLGLSSCFEV